MPVYLCKPGCWAAEPWRHGIQVYAYPFAIDGNERRSQDDENDDDDDKADNNNDTQDIPTADEDVAPHDTPAALLRRDKKSQEGTKDTAAGGQAIRRVRHAEVVLVDDVCIAYGRYWLRLRWPGKGGFAGYIALGKAAVTRQLTEVSDDRGMFTTEDPPLQEQQLSREASEEENDGYFALTADDDDATQKIDNTGTTAASPTLASGPLRCLRTGLYFPSSSAMQLLANYEDGLSPTVAIPTSQDEEPVFCRICREGLHDDDEQPKEGVKEPDDVVVDPPTTFTTESGPIQPHPAYHSNNYAAENPLLAPCECSGSMAFVHYLCVEQWRCRSRHPEARNGLNCETCSSPYALPPPSSRPVVTLPGMVAEEDWLEAMPAHVMAALRQPHIWWQMGAAIVRRRWLRPIAPILMSPIVALYCRARRLLKKRGVSRRRWACSLCRRRARWKCVRCLRSYYCSRQCQNVSWHIVHKHVCYKPSRFWWSVVVYSTLSVAAFPGILKDPLIYDLGLSLIPASFFVMGILGGGIAMSVKRLIGVDMRGRLLELVVLLLTLWLIQVTWGLVWALFGDVTQCKGILGPHEPSRWLHLLRKGLFGPSQTWFFFWDRLALQTPSWIRSVMCSSPHPEACFAHTSHADFYLEPSCASDLHLVTGLWTAAGTVLVASTLWKRHERLLRARARAGRLDARLHQD